MNTRGGSRPSVFKNPIAIVSAAIVSGIASIGASAQSAQVEHPINSVREIRASLRACWISPEMSVPPQVTVRLSLKRNGVILGQPLISYENPHISEADRAALHEAVAAALARCTPLNDPRMKARITDFGYSVFASSPDDFGNFIAAYTEKWAKVIKLTGAKVY